MLKAFFKKKKKVEEVFKRVLEFKNWESLERVKENQLKSFEERIGNPFLKKRKLVGRNFKKKNAMESFE